MIYGMKYEIFSCNVVKKNFLTNKLVLFEVKEVFHI